MTRTRSTRRAGTRPTAAAPAGTAPARATGAGTIAFILLLAVPRIVRMAWPQVWIEDESYLNGAFMLATGHAPYTGFALPHFPLLEGALAVLLRIFPASIRTAEAFTQAAAFTASLFIWRIGRRLGGRWCGAAAALVFAVSPIVFRYHVFEREVFLIVPVLAAAWLVLRDGGDEAAGATRRGLATGALLAVAMAIKLTAASYAVAVFLFLLFARRRREALACAASLVILMGTATIGLLAWFGMPFFVQVILFRLVHAGFPSWAGRFVEFLRSVDLAFAAGVVGLVIVVVAGRARRWALPLLLLGAGFLLLVVLNPTFWAHDSVELLPWLALFAGVTVAAIADAWRRPADEAETIRLSRGAAAVAAIVTLALLVFVTPVRHEGWGPGASSAYGFGYRDRSEIDQVAAFIRARTSPGERVAVPPILAFQANRPELVVYPELAGTMMQLQAQVTAQGWLRTWRQSDIGKKMFWDEVAASRDAWLPMLARAIEQHTVGAVVDFSPDDLFPVPLIDVPAPTLRQYGYTPGLATTHYQVWVPAGT
ncbi:MAG: glycosyltransferase family 39 protein [Acidobacteriota bacterium]|nr:glycosyltransferase family 39 protein [Acidobacteriota bacterium]